MKVGVIGLGNFGTALSNHLASQGYEVLGWDRKPKLVSGINEQHRNPFCLSEVSLHSNLKATEDLAAVCSRELVLLAVSSAGLSALLPRLEFSPDTILVSLIKGVQRAERKTPLQYCSDHLNPHPKFAVLSGPSFAIDVVAGKPAGLVAASKDEEVAKVVAQVFANEWMKIYHSDDPLGVELGGITKNVIALAAGMVDGLGWGDSARAGLITRGLYEMVQLAIAMGAKERTLFGLAGLGDLVLTATCDASRNRTAGKALGRGEKIDDITKSIGSAVEGVRTAPIVTELAHSHGVEMPISECVNAILKGDVSAKEGLQQLIVRPLKKEFSA